jgi:alkylation response protein AidB-like acyl-CoA dehydrogenase
VNLELNDDENSVAVALERVFARESPIDRVRAAEAAGFDPALWKVLTEMGAVGMALPESAGGAGGGLVSLALAAEAAGRHLACVPIVEAAAATLVLAETGGEHAAIAAASGDRPPVVLAPRAAVDGAVAGVPGGAVASAVVALDGDELVLAHGAPGTPARDLGYLGVADRPLHGEGVERQVLAAGRRAHDVWDMAVGWWRLGTASACAGLARQTLDVAAGYARTRSQFGVPIGSFQAIQQILVDPAMAAEGALLLVREAAWRYDHGLASWRSAADIAYAHAAETAVRAAEACLHVHGGYGYTLEYDAQLYLRRAKALLLLGGDPEAIWARIGTGTAGGTAGSPADGATSPGAGGAAARAEGGAR